MKPGNSVEEKTLTTRKGMDTQAWAPPGRLWGCGKPWTRGDGGRAQGVETALRSKGPENEKGCPNLTVGIPLGEHLSVWRGPVLARRRFAARQSWALRRDHGGAK
jgi:hypothetical protein